MNPSRMMQFLIEERCDRISVEGTGMVPYTILMPKVADFIQFCDARKAFRLMKKEERRLRKEARNCRKKSGPERGVVN